MRTVKIVLIVLVAVFVMIPMTGIVLLTAIAAVGANANEKFEEINATLVTASSPELTGPRTTVGNVTLVSDASIPEFQVKQVAETLASKLLLGSSEMDHLYRLSANRNGYRLTNLTRMATEGCEQFRPINEFVATILSFECFDGGQVEVVSLPNNGAGEFVSTKRADVVTCWVDEISSVFFGQEETEETIANVVATIRSTGLLEDGQQPKHFFLRRRDQGGEVSFVSAAAAVDQIDPEVLKATMRERALMLSLTLFDGAPCKFSLTGIGFDELTSFEHDPPFQARCASRNGCMLVLSDGTVSLEAVEAIAAKLMNFPGRELKMDLWVRSVDGKNTALVPLLRGDKLDAETFQILEHVNGMTIKGELPLDQSLEMICCDLEFKEYRSFSVEDYVGPTIIRNNNRLHYWYPFEEPFANEVADYLEREGVFTDQQSFRFEIFGSEDPAEPPMIQVYIDPQTLDAKGYEIFETFGRKMMSDLFAEQTVRFRIVDMLGQTVKSFTQEGIAPAE